MQVPENWNTLHREPSRSTVTSGKKRKSPALPHASTALLSVPIEPNPHMPEHATELQLHTLISRLPFNEMLGQMMVDSGEQIPEVPVVTKCFEESFMREPIHEGELQCICGEQCEARFIDPDQSFIAVQFTLGNDVDARPTMCVLCTRRTTQELFYDLVYGNRSMSGLIQRYGVICGPKEYAKEALLLCPPHGPLHNMPLPSVAHHRHKYSVIVQNGVRYLVQRNVSYEDFQ
jgi:hypothetical protein